MSPEEFEAVVEEAVNRLPEWVHDALDNIDLLIVDDADEGLDPEGEGLLGLYVGLPLTERGVEYVAELPDVIYLFRNPHLELGLPQDELVIEIEKTLVHELAHYFGFEDAELEQLGYD